MIFVTFLGPIAPFFCLALGDFSNSGRGWATKATGCVITRSSVGAQLTETLECSSHREDICPPSATGTESPVGWSLPGGGGPYNLGHPPTNGGPRLSCSDSSATKRTFPEQGGHGLPHGLPCSALQHLQALLPEIEIRCYAKSPGQSFLPLFCVGWV